MPAILTLGAPQLAVGDAQRMPMDFGNESLLIEGYTIVAYNVTCTDEGGPTISARQLDYPYQLSCLVTATNPGDFDIVFTITLNDPDSSVRVRTGTLKVL